MNFKQKKGHKKAADLHRLAGKKNYLKWDLYKKIMSKTHGINSQNHELTIGFLSTDLSEFCSETDSVEVLSTVILLS